MALLKRVAPGWLAKSIAAAKATSPERREWIEAIRANWIKDD